MNNKEEYFDIFIGKSRVTLPIDLVEARHKWDYLQIMVNAYFKTFDDILEDENEEEEIDKK
jgi:hypothetical protein